MVRWYHAIFSAYGFWLPNDPRGSWSDFVHSWELFRIAGPATTVNGRRSYAQDPHDARFRREAKRLLKHPPARFDDRCRHSIAHGFEVACTEFGLQLHACAIGFDHVHIVTSRHERYSVEDVVKLLKTRATQSMNREKTHPYPNLDPPPTPWGKGCWSVFINTQEQLESAIRYVERHPMKEGLAPQKWSFVRPVR